MQILKKNRTIKIVLLIGILITIACLSLTVYMSLFPVKLYTPGYLPTAPYDGAKNDVLFCLPIILATDVPTPYKISQVDIINRDTSEKITPIIYSYDVADHLLLGVTGYLTLTELADMYKDDLLKLDDNFIYSNHLYLFLLFQEQSVVNQKLKLEIHYDMFGIKQNILESDLR